MVTKLGQFSSIRPLSRYLGHGSPDVRAHIVSYKSGDLDITGWLYEPANEPVEIPTHPIDCPAPENGALLVGHGGIWGIPAHYDAVLRRLAKAGWTVVAPNYRGEDRSDGLVQFALGEVDDTLACACALGSLPCVDPAKIRLLGSSHGATVNLLASAREQNMVEFSHAVSVSGVYDMTSWVDWLKKVNHHLLVDPDLRRLLDCSPDELTSRSVLSVVDRIRIPVLLVHGEGDTMVPVDQTRELAQAFEKLGKSDVRLRIQPGSDHEFIWAPERKDARETWQEIIDFMGEAIN